MSTLDPHQSAPHVCAMDRLRVVVSDIWCCSGSADFSPRRTIPVVLGGFVGQRAATPQSDGLLPDPPEPTVIAPTGMGPVLQTRMDTALPSLRRVSAEG